MKNTEGKLKKIEEYSKWLAEQLDELCISQSELASAVGKSQKTISRYVNSENMPNKATRAAIDSFIEEHSVFQGFRHIPSKEFSDILLRLLEEFNISQVELAKKIGKYQKNISNYIYGVEKADTKTQKDILFYFKSSGLPYNAISSVHFGTQVQLGFLLDGNNKELAAKYHFGERCAYSHSIAFLLSLPTSLQKLILDNISAFVDCYFVENVICYFEEDISLITDISLVKNCDGTFLVALTDDRDHFGDYKNCMKLFGDLSPHYKKVMRSELEKYARLEVPRNDQYDLRFYNHILQYYNVIKYSVIHSKKRNEPFSIKETEEQDKDKDKHIIALEKFLDIGKITEDDMIFEIKYKLDFDADDWYLWMLFVMYHRNGNGIEYLEEEMRRYVNLPEPEEQPEKEPPVNTNLTQFPPIFPTIE